MNNRFSEKGQKVLMVCVKLAEEFGHTYIGTEHLLWALADVFGSSSAALLNKKGVFSSDIKKMISEYSGCGSKTTLTPKDLTPKCKKILELSSESATRYGNHYICTEHILLALLLERDCVATKIIKALNVDPSKLREDVVLFLKSKEKIASSVSSDSGALSNYGVNFNEIASLDGFDPVIGREKETDRIIRILTRKNKNNPCLIGEAGVGKSAIVEGLAQKIINGDVPDFLKNKSIISVDLTSMVAGAKYRGDFEERIKNIIKEVSKRKDVILFIDEIHTIVGAGAAEGAIDASNILKPQLSRGDIQIIGATTFDEYKKYIERDPALERRFQPIIVEEPGVDRTIEMLMGLKGRYEKHHNVVIPDEIIEDCVRFSVRYISDRYLPDKAIDLLDEVCSYASVRSDENNIEIENIDNIIEQTKKSKENALLDFDIKKAFEMKSKEQSLLFEKGKIENLKDNKRRVLKSDVSYVLSDIFSVSKIQENDSFDFNSLENRLNEKVLGQRTVVKKLASSLIRSFCYSNEDKPKGFYLFVGQSGVGKTTLAKELTSELFSGVDYFIRIDMSEYSEGHTIAKLIGAPPGYAGHDEGGYLTEAVRKKPFSLIYVENFEKASKDVQSVFLQIYDKGFLTDGSGKKISFKNCYIIFSCSLPSLNSLSKSVGFVELSDNDKRARLDELDRYFPAALISRFDEIFLFDPLDEAALYEIASNRLQYFCDRLKKQRINIIFHDEIISFLVKKSVNKKEGARKLLRVISEYIEKPIFEKIYGKGSSVNELCLKIYINEDNICISEEVTV